jgi:hypothetical protein
VRHVRMLGLCLVAAFAVAAVAASSAVAGPQWVKCELAGPGHNYTGPNCSKEAGEKAKPKGTGEYELYKAAEVEAKRIEEGKPGPLPFSGKSGKALLNTGGLYCENNLARITREACVNGGGEVKQEEVGLSVECEEETNEGLTVGQNAVEDIEVTFTGCLLAGEVECHSAGAVEGEIKTNTLKGKLGWIDKTTTPKKVGIQLTPQAGKSTPFAEFTCLFELVKTVVGRGNKKEGAYYVKGVNYPEGCGGICLGATPEEEKKGGNAGIISPITPVNTMTKTFEQKFVGNKNSAEPQNVPSKLENKPIALLEDYVENFLYEPPYSIMWSPASEELTNVNTVGEGEEGEIKA